MQLNCKVIKKWQPPPPHLYINPPFSGLSPLSIKILGTLPPSDSWKVPFIKEFISKKKTISFLLEHDINDSKANLLR